MTTTHTNLALVEGEMYVLGMQMKIEKQELPRIHKVSEQFMLINNNYTSIILASTAKLKGITKLDRKHFVKPKVDVEEKFKTHCSKERLSSSEFHFDIFKAGYNAKEAEFTRGEMFSLVVAVQNKEVVSYDDFENYMNKIRPLSLPKSVTLNENNEVIAVEW